MMLSVSATAVFVILALTSRGVLTSSASRYRQQQHDDDRLQHYGQGCSSPRKPLHGVYLWMSKISVQYTCRPGFVLVGDVRGSCQRGRWTSPPPLCLSRNCKLTPVKHGTTYLRHGGAMARVHCHRGYTLHGPQFLACTNGHWNGTQPECLSPRRNASRRRERHRQSDGKNKEKKTHEDWLNEADYSCIQDRGAVPPPAVINARHTTSWAMYEGRPRLYTTYRCKWGYVARPADTTGNLYCRRGVWVGTAPFCQRFVNNGRAIQVDVVGQSPHQSLKSLLRRADYTCSGVRPPSVSRADVKLEFDVVDAQPRLYAKYSCHDGLVLKDRTRQFMYCLRRKWIGVLPTCVIDRSGGCRVNNGGCMQKCLTKNGAVQCSCNGGYRLADDQHTCLDVDECEENNAGCGHICDNTPGSYRCNCYAGYQLNDNDQRTCYASHDNRVGLQ